QIADSAQLLEERMRRNQIATLSLNRLDDDRGDFLGRDKSVEELVLDVGGVAVGRMVYAGDQRAETAPLCQVARRQGEGAHRTAMETAVESDELIASGGVTRQL